MTEALNNADVTKLCLNVCIAARAVLCCAIMPCPAPVSQSVLSLVDYSKAFSIYFYKPGANSVGPFKFSKCFLP
jgi:hypothetical protein